MRFTLAFAAAASFAAAAPLPADEAAEALVRRIEAHHRSARDLTARFQQTYRSGLLGQEIVESGRLALKRPGRMRWEYERPEKKTFVADGDAFYFYVPEDRQVVIRDQGEGGRGVAMSLLSGGAAILDEFTAELEIDGAGPPRLRLTPRQPDPDVEQVWVEVDAKARIRSIEIVDLQSNRSLFRFDDVRENVGLKDDEFRFEIPRGVDVVRG